MKRTLAFVTHTNSVIAEKAATHVTDAGTPVRVFPLRFIPARGLRRAGAGFAGMTAMLLLGNVLSASLALAQIPAPGPASLTAAPDSAAAEVKRRFDAATRRSDRLFGPQAPLEFTVIADYRTIFRDRDTLSTKKFPARVTGKDSTGKEYSFDLQLSTRGHWRLKPANCGFPPLKMNFDVGTSGTPFQGQKGIKLGTHCRPDSEEYAEYVIREYLAYRVFNTITDLSLRARLARVTYIDSTARNKPVTTWGLLIEDEDDAARRNMGNILETRGLTFNHVDPVQLGIVGVFEFLIGNTDWSLPALHNIRVVQGLDMIPRTLAYDFDWSGLVSARYATPDPRFAIRSVQDRLYRGPCLSPDDMRKVLDLFRSRRAAIMKLYEEAQGLDPTYVRFVQNYLTDFFRTIDNPEVVKSAIVDRCRDIGEE